MSGRNSGSSAWKAVSVVLGAILFALIVFGVFLISSQRVSRLDPADTETSSEPVSQSPDFFDVEQDFEGFTMTIGVPATGQSISDPVDPSGLKVDDPPLTDHPATADGDYLCPESSTTYLTRSRVDELDAMYRGTMPDGKTVPQMIINEIYAKNGYLFKNQILQAYYNRKPWYSGYLSDMQAVTNKLNSVEKANVDFLRNNYTG